MEVLPISLFISLVYYLRINFSTLGWTLDMEICTERSRSTFSIFFDSESSQGMDTLDEWIPVEDVKL